MWGTGVEANIGSYLFYSNITSAAGDIAISGSGATTTGDHNYGVILQGGSVSSTATGTNAATITIDGTGGTGVANNRGIFITSATVDTISGELTINGQAGGTGGDNIGVYLDYSNVTSTGTGINAAAITIIGTGGNGTDFNHGIFQYSNTTTSVDGNISLTGQGGDGTGIANIGTLIDSGSVVSSTGTGIDAATISIDGTGGTSSVFGTGVKIDKSTTKVTSVDGDIFVTGQGSSGSGGVHFGVNLSDAEISSSGTGTDAATITVYGTGGTGGGSNDGISFTGVSGDADVTSVAGDISITSADNAAFSNSMSINSTSGNITILADAAAGNNGNIIALHDGTIINAGSGNIDLDTDGTIFLSGLVTSGHVTIDTTSGSILDNGDANIDIIAGTANINASGSIGTGANPLETQIGFYTASSGTNDTNINNRELFSINDISANEDGSFVFTVSLSRATDQDVTVLASTSTGTAGAGDFTAISNQLVTIAAGQTSATVTVNVSNDSIGEDDENFSVVLSDPKFNGSTDLSRIDIGDVTGTGTIIDDDNTASVALNESIAAFKDGGIVTTSVLASDIDNDDDANSLTYIVISQPTEGIANSNGDGTFTFNPGIQFQDLAAGETRDVTFTFTATDTHNDVSNIGTVTVTVTGVNDVSTVGVAPTLSLTEDDGANSLNLLTGANDIDTNDTLNVSNLLLVSGDISGITVSGDGNSLNIAPGAYNGLAANESELITYSYNIIDGNGGSVAQTASITINGINDPPTVSPGLSSTKTEDDTTYNLDLLSTAIDGDMTDTLNISDLLLISGDISGVTVSSDGNSFDIDPSAYSSLATGESEVISYSYNIIDGNGGSVAQTASITINGVNDAPIAFDDAFSTNEDSTLNTGNVLNVNPTSADSDIDLNNILSITEINGDSGNVSTQITLASGALLTANADGSFSYDPNGQFETLTAGESTTDTFTYKIDDGNGGTDTAIVTILINGVNDLPTLNPISAPAPIDEDAIEQTINLSGITAGGGETQTLTVTATSDNPALIANPVVTYTPGQSTGTLSYTPETDQNGTAVITVTVTDAQAGEITQTFTVEVNPINDAPTAEDDSFSLFQNDTINDSLYSDNSNGTDSDPDTSDTFTITEVNDSTGNVATQLTLASGAFLTVNADGTFTYDPNGQFDSLAAGDTATDTFTYKIDDGNGETDTATATITITGSNATLTINDVIVNENDGTATFNVSLDKPVVEVVSIDYSFADNTAISGSDFSVPGGPFTLNFDGTTAETKTITVTINDENIVEFDESFFVNLINLQSIGGYVDLADAQGVGTINASDSAVINILDVTATEDGLFSFEITLDQPAAEEITVLVNTATGTADANDFTAIENQLITFGAGETTATVTVTVLDDLLIEADESFTVTISDPTFNGINSPSQITIGDNTATGTIQNNDLATISISDANIDEDAGTATFYVSVDKELGQLFSVDYETTDGTATVLDGDYLSNSGKLVFFGNANETLAITVLITNDQYSEATENFYVNLSDLSINSPNLVLGDSEGEATINDDDSASLSINDININEADGTAVFTVTLDRDIDSAITVDWSTADGTAVNSTDYIANSGSLTFEVEGEKTKTISIDLPQDTEIESIEQFVINLTNVQATGQNVNISDSQGVATISDDDSASLAINDITVNEGDGTAVFTVTLTGQIDEDVTVDWSTADNTADDISDYEANSGQLTFDSTTGSTQTITINLRSDEYLEETKSFYVNLTNAITVDKTITIADAQGEATISANAEEFSINDIILTEGDGAGTKTMTFTVTRNGADLTSQATIDFRTLTDPATLGGGDFVEIITPVTLTFAAAAVGIETQTQTVSVTINSDDTIELDEEFTVQIENTSQGTIAKAQGTGTIANDDLATLTITGTEISPGNAPLIYAENDGTAEVIVTLDKAVSNGFTLEWSTADIDALAGIDYTADSGTLTFAGNAGETQTITITLLNDMYVESDETFEINFDEPIIIINDPENHELEKNYLEANLSLVSDNAVVEITNDDDAVNASISISKPLLVVESPNQVVDFVVTLDQPLPNGGYFSFSTVDGTALAGIDYHTSSGTLFFRGNANEQHTIQVSIIDDNIAELNETFYIELTQLSGTLIPIDRSEGFIDIYDSDRPAITVSTSDITISEDDEIATFTVSLSEAAIVDLSMLVNTGDPSDTAGLTDYFSLTDYRVTIPAGETSVTIDVPLYRDLLVEPDETFTLTLSDLQANGGTATGWATLLDATSIATITDVETTGIDISNPTVDETAGTVTFTVSMDTATSADVTFDASTVAGTATDGADYTGLTNQPYTITAGQTSVDITVNITNDTAFELNETFSLALSNILVGGVVDDRLTVLNNSGVATINDDEAATLTIADLTVNENGNNAILTVTVDQIVGYSFTVDWATQGLTAYGESDYSTSAGTITFDGLTANETQQITIPITDDDIVEWDETFLVNLSNVSAAGANVTLADDQAEVTISSNNDIAQISISDLIALEHNQFGFEITIDNAATRDITVLANTADGTANSSDYTALVDSLVTIAAGQTSAFVYVTVNDDSLVEGNETFTITLTSEQIDGAIDATRVGIADGTATGTISNNDYDVTTTTNTTNSADDYYFVKVEDLGTSVELNVLSNDTKTGTTTITSITAASGGGAASVGQTAGDDVIVFTPGVSASGTITFSYTFEDSLQNTGTGQVTIVIVDLNGITGDFENDRFVPGIETPGLGKVPEYISQKDFAANYFTKFENPTLADDTETVNTLDTITYENALGTGGSFTVTTDIDSTLTSDYTDLGSGNWTYSEILVSTYSITTSFSEDIGDSNSNTINLVQSGSHDYNYLLTRTVPGSGNATTGWTLTEDASDHYTINVEMTVEEPGEDDYTTVKTITLLNGMFNNGSQTYDLTTSELKEDDGQGGELLIAEAHDLTISQEEKYRELIVAIATIAPSGAPIGTSTITINTDGNNEWTLASDRDYDYVAIDDEYINSEGFSYSSNGHDDYTSVEDTLILGTITETEDVTITEETTDANGVVTPAVILSTTITTDNNIDIDTTDTTHDEFSFTDEGEKEFNNLGTNTLDTELTTFSHSDSGYSDYSTDAYSEIDINSVNSLVEQRFYTLEDIVENSHSEYATTTSNTSRPGNTSGSAHSEYTSSGWSNYDIYTQNIIESTVQIVTGITDLFTSNEIADNDGSDSYRDVEILDEQIVGSNLEGTSTYLSASNGVDHHSLNSTTFTSTVNTVFPGSSLTVTSLLESTDQGTTNWVSSYSNQGNYQSYDAINPISALGLIYHSYNLENYEDTSSGGRTITYHTRDTSAYSEGATLIVSSIDDYNESNRSYNFVDSSSGSSEYTTDEVSLDSTGDQRTSTFVIDQQDQYSYSESNGSTLYVIDQDSNQFVDNVVGGITTQMTGLDQYDETGSKTWNVNNGGASTYNSTDVSTTVDAGENWTVDELNSTSESTAHDWSEYKESSTSSFLQHSDLDHTTVDESVAGIKYTVQIITLYDEASGTVTPEAGEMPITNNSFSSTLRTDDYLYADGTTSSIVDSKSKESNASTYSLSESREFELINTIDPTTTSEQRGFFSHTRSNGERTSRVDTLEISTITGTQLPEGTPDTDADDPLASVYNLNDIHYVKVGRITNDEKSTDRSEFTKSETTSTSDLTVQNAGQSTPDSQNQSDILTTRAGESDTSDGIAPHAGTGGFGGSGSTLTFGNGLNVPSGNSSPMGGTFYRISTSNSSSSDAGKEFTKILESSYIGFVGDLGTELESIIQAHAEIELTEHGLSYDTFVASRTTPAPDAGSGVNASGLSSFESSRSEYSETISDEPDSKHETFTFFSLTSSENTDGDQGSSEIGIGCA